MKKIKPDPIPDKLLHIKNAYKVAAATWVIEMIMKNRKAYDMHLNVKEMAKVDKEIDRIIDKLMIQRRKDHGPIPKHTPIVGAQTRGNIRVSDSDVSKPVQ